MASTKNGIIYPDNYDKVADVPADMKVLAESVDGNIERINKNLDKNADELKNLQKDNTGNKTAIEAINKKNTKQDTNIQKNAKDIEANQNNIKALQVENAEVKAENERLRSDIESISLLGEAEGESIDLDNSSGARFKKFGVGGNHSQETREGYNKFKPFDSSNIINSNGTTVKIQNEKIIINGVCTKQWWCEIYYKLGDGTAVQTDKKENLDSSKTYTFGLQRISGGIIQGYVNATVVIDENDKSIGGVAIATSNKNGTSKTFTDGNGIYRAYLYIPQNAVFNNLEFGVLIYEGSEAKDWEQYGATPSLKFPSEIKTVKDNINEVVCNANVAKINESDWILTENNTIKNKGATGGRVLSSFFAKKGQYIYLNLKMLSKPSLSTTFTVTENGKEVGKGHFLELQNMNLNIIYTKTFKVESDSKIELKCWGNDNSDIFEFQFWAEVGEATLTDYEVHQEQAITMPTQQEMLKEDYFDFENEKGVHKWNLLSFTGNEAWSLLSGATSVFLLGNVSGQTYGGHNFSMCTHFKYDTRVGGMANLQDETFAMQYEYSALYVKCNKFTTVEEWKAYLKSQYENGTPIKLAYITANITKLSFTDEQKVVAKKIKETLHTYKNITHIYSTDETSPIMNVEYAKDPNTQNNNLQNQIDEIKQLISTTQTSAMLLDNLQKEVESEVE